MSLPEVPAGVLRAFHKDDRFCPVLFDKETPESCCGTSVRGRLGHSSPTLEVAFKDLLRNMFPSCTESGQALQNSCTVTRHLEQKTLPEESSSRLHRFSLAAAPSLTLVQEAFLSLTPDTAAGPSGLRPQHIKVGLLAGYRDELMRSLHSVVRIMAVGTISGPIVSLTASAQP